MTTLTRRAALGVIAGSAAAIAGGAVLVRLQSEEHLFRTVIEHYLGPVSISDTDMAAFITHFQEKRGHQIPGANLSDAWTAARRLGLHEPAQGLLPDGPAAAIQRFERWVLAEFHMVTDIGWRRGPEDQVTFQSTTACLNPFANFEAA